MSVIFALKMIGVTESVLYGVPCRFANVSVAMGSD